MSGPSGLSPIAGPQRANSMGPNGPLPSPSGPLVNGIGAAAGPSNASVVGGGAGSGQPPMSQQNLNQIVSTVSLSDSQVFASEQINPERRDLLKSLLVRRQTSEFSLGISSRQPVFISGSLLGTFVSNFVKLPRWNFIQYLPSLL